MKKIFIKSIAMIMMLAIVLSCVAVSASAVNIVTYSDRCEGLFSCNLKGDVEGTTGYYRSMARTTRISNAYEHIYVKTYLEYTDGEWEQEWDVASLLSSVSVVIEVPVSNRIAHDVSSYHMMYNGDGSAANIEYLAGDKWLGYRS